MTLGGLALAVGILVDDATVDDREHQLASGAGQGARAGHPRRRAADRRAGVVSTLCICIVFVPMFFLAGVARLSVRAAGRGGGVRDAGLVRAVAHAGADAREVLLHGHDDAGARRPQPSRDPLTRFQRGFERGFERCASAIARMLDACAASRWHRSSSASCVPVVSRSLCCRCLGQDFFPSVDAGQIRLHLRARPALRIEETARAVRSGRAAHPQRDSAERARQHRRQHRPALSAASICPTATSAPSDQPTPTS